MYSAQFLTMSISKCRVKCVVHWRGGREGSFPERTGQPLLPPFLKRMYNVQYSLLYIVTNNDLYNI
jgi:hypothetical protein